MRTVYRVLAWIVAVEVLLQAAAITYAIFGLGKWIQEGGVLDKSVMESEVTAFPEEVGFMVHGLNGQMIVPVVALLLLIVSFFAKVPRGVALAGTVVGLVALQVRARHVRPRRPRPGRAARRDRAGLFAMAVVAARRAALPVGPAGVPAVGRAGDRHLTEFPTTFPLQTQRRPDVDAPFAGPPAADRPAAARRARGARAAGLDVGVELRPLAVLGHRDGLRRRRRGARPRRRTTTATPRAGCPSPR